MPATGATPALPLIETLDAAALDRIEAGETLVLAPLPDALKPNAVLGHTAAFWNTLWTDGQAPHTLGLLIDNAHPLFGHFPSDSHSDWHWWELTHGRRAFDMGGLAQRPLVRVIDDWNANRDLVLLSEVQIGRGRLILSAIDLQSDLEDRLVAAAFRRALAAYLAQNAVAAPAVSRHDAEAWWQEASA